MKKITVPSRITDRGNAKRDLIAGLVLNKDWNFWKLPSGEAAYPETIRLLAASNDRDFFVKLGKALYEGRHSKNSLVHNFIIWNWNDGHNGGPPLKSLTADAACDRLAKEFPDRPVMSANAYRKILKRLHLAADK